MAKAHFRLVPYRILPKVDWLLLVTTLALATFGVVSIWGAISGGNGPGMIRSYALKQAIYFAIGSIVMVVTIILNYQSLKRVTWLLYGILMVLLAGVLVFGQKINGARSWYDLGFLNFQPSEPGKIIVILALAQYLAPRVGTFRGLIHTIKPLLIAGGPMGLIMLQPDLGSTVVYMPTIAAMFWVAGLRKWVFFAAFLAGVGVAITAYPHLKPYQKDRIKTFVNPSTDPRGKNWNIVQSMVALGSGQLTGKGWGRGTQTNFHFLPEYHTDFIFPTVGEQFGLIGCTIALLLMLILIARMIYLANVTQDVFGVLIITGLAAMFCTHIILNVGMTIGLLPVTGLPLPFFSYGGTFVFTCMTSVGLTVGIGARRGL